MLKSWISLALLAFSVPSHAVVYGGNPNFTFYVQRPANDLVSGDVDLTKVRIHNCGGGYTDYAGVSNFDPVDGGTKQISGGDLCGATFFWGNDMLLNGYDGASFIYEYTANTTDVVFASPTIPPVGLTGATVLSGSPSGPGPRIYVDIY